MFTYKEQNGPSKKYLDLCACHQKKEAEAATFIIQKLHQTSQNDVFLNGFPEQMIYWGTAGKGKLPLVLNSY